MDNDQTPIIDDENGNNSPRRDWKLYNVIVLGISFMFMFTSFQTCSMAEESILADARIQSNGTFTGNGYTSLSIIYGVFSLANWIGPSVLAMCGARLSMFLGASCYLFFIASFLKPMTWLLYSSSALVGLGAAIIWNGQGSFLTQNSNKLTIGRNSGIFWSLLQCSLLIGNVYMYVAFRGEINISKSARDSLFTVLLVAMAIGMAMLLLLRKPVATRFFIPSDEATVSVVVGPMQAFKKSVSLFITRDMLLLSLTFLYTGLELTFFSGVYTTCIGNTLHFEPDNKSLIGMCGIMIGIGEILGGTIFGFLGRFTPKYGRDPITTFSFLVHMMSFYLIFLNLPPDVPFRSALQSPYFFTDKYVAMVCAFLLGLGDSGYNTQIMSILGDVYSNDSGPAFALFKFVQSLAAAVAFFYSQYLTLPIQLAILVGFAVVGTGGFTVVEWKHRHVYDNVQEEDS